MAHKSEAELAADKAAGEAAQKADHVEATKPVDEKTDAALKGSAANIEHAKAASHLLDNPTYDKDKDEPGTLGDKPASDLVIGAENPGLLRGASEPAGMGDISGATGGAPNGGVSGSQPIKGVDHNGQTAKPGDAPSTGIRVDG